MMLGDGHPAFARRPQPMVRQTRRVLDQYKANGGSYEEVVITDAGHTPYIEKPEEFLAAFTKVLK